MASNNAVTLPIEVAYAGPERAVVIPLMVAAGATIREAVAESGIMEQCPDIDLERNRVGVFSRLCGPDDQVRAGDRIEIYRPLPADPKQLRRQRAQQQGQNRR